MLVYYIGTRPDRHWGPPTLLYNGYRVSFRGLKWLESGVYHPPPSTAEAKERVELPFLWTFMACSRVKFTFYDIGLGTYATGGCDNNSYKVA